jgi:hypothetical protein
MQINCYNQPGQVSGQTNLTQSFRINILKKIITNECFWIFFKNSIEEINIFIKFSQILTI